MPVINVLFVCLGNICRSPMADAVFQHVVREAGLADQIQVDSAGTGSWHVGEEPHYGTRGVLRKHHVVYEGRARQFEYGDFRKFDYILAMDRENLSDIMRLVNRGEHSSQEKLERFYSKHQPEIDLFLSYAHRAGLVEKLEVPDPYYTGRFDEVYDLVRTGCDALLNHIRQKHQI